MQPEYESVKVITPWQPKPNRYDLTPRQCAEEDCITILNRYNLREKCLYHFQREEARKASESA